jgi:predicted Rdx family selenoprotein
LNDAGHEASAEEGAKGQYDVLADGELVFSKQEQGRFPDGPEVRALLG